MAMNPKNLVLAFSPLVLFTVAGHLLGPSAAGWAALGSAVLALVLLIAGLRHGVKLITAVSVVTFGGLAAVALLGGPTGRWFVDVFGSAVAALLIGLMMLVSVGTVPFTEQYARAVVPREHWGSPEFTAINAKISLAWAGVVTGIGLSRLAYGLLVVATGDRVGTLLRLGLSWAVPIVLVVAGLRYTQRLAGDDHDGPRRQGAPTEAVRPPESRP
jgi:hypothetical protein